MSLDDQPRQPNAPPGLNHRSGLNSSEAAIAWAMVHFSGNLEACKRLQGDVGSEIRAAVEPALKLPENRRFQLVERWRDEDRRWDRLDGLLERVGRAEENAFEAQRDARWTVAYECIRTRVAGRRRPWKRASSRTRRAVEWLAIGDMREAIPFARPELRNFNGFDLDLLVEMPCSELIGFIRQLGVYQLAELSYRQPRRSLVRLRQRLLEEDRDWFDFCVFGDEHLEDEERGRLRKLFSAVSTQGSDMSSYLAQIGLYSIAVATGLRFARKMERALEQLPADISRSLRQYNQRAARAPIVLSGQLRVTMNEFVRQRRAFLEDMTNEQLSPVPGSQSGFDPVDQERI